VNFPASDVNLAQPLLSVAFTGGGVALGVLGGRLVCSWALTEKLNPRATMAIAKILVICSGYPFKFGSNRKAYTDWQV
jgi:hypothetical protein